MTALPVAQLIAADRMAERERLAAASRLAALAREGRPGVTTRVAHRLTQAVARRKTARRPAAVAAPCGACA